MRQCYPGKNKIFLRCSIELVRRNEKMVAREGFEPTTFGLCVPLQFSLPDFKISDLKTQFVVWTLSSPAAFTVRVPSV